MIKILLALMAISLSLTLNVNAQNRKKKDIDPNLFISAIYDQKSDSYKAVSLRVDVVPFGRAPIYLGIQGGKIQGVQFDPNTKTFINSKDGEAYLGAVSAGLSAIKGKLKVGVQGTSIMGGMKQVNSTMWQVSDEQFVAGPEILVNAQVIKRVYLTVGASNQTFNKFDSNTLAARAGLTIGIGNRKP
ncbi:MAG: hypothetical protein KA715_08345 [Xanthomonadaceae bacterium]|nr:hypothetical protein [Xanthomonadaceae bacterium]